jgi:hypothetical protein
MRLNRELHMDKLTERHKQMLRPLRQSCGNEITVHHAGIHVERNAMYASIK